MPSLIPESSDHMYFVQDSFTGHMKVGRAADPESRLKALQTGCPGHLRIVCAVENGGWMEPIIHTVFRAFAIRGEWYPSESPVAHLAVNMLADSSPACVLLSLPAALMEAVAEEYVRQNRERGAVEAAAWYRLVAKEMALVADHLDPPAPPQRELWDYAAYEVNIAEHVSHARSNVEKARGLADECREKYGRAPTVPVMIGGASEGAAD